MTVRRILFVLSADFGEYVTATIFSRGQPFERYFAVPRRLAPYCGPEGGDFDVYEDAGGLRRIIAAQRPHAVVFCSGYLFSINGLMAPDEFAALVAELKRSGIVLATTDPWLRVFAINPRARFTIQSVRKGGVDAEASERVACLYRDVARLFHGIPHLLAVPLLAPENESMSFFNPVFCSPGRAPERGDGRDWLFVLAREDLVLLAGFGRERFFGRLEKRLDEVISVAENRATFIGPTELSGYFAERVRRWPRLTFVPFCSFAAFEAAIRRASVVVYWNLLSASLLYCLYHRVPPVFFGEGHQVAVCPALRDHVIEHVYRGRPPAMLDFDAPVEPRAGLLVQRFDLFGMLDAVRRDYERLPAPWSVVEKMMVPHAVG